MGRRDELIAGYAAELRDICGIDPDPRLLERVAIGCGPAIYDPKAATIDAADDDEIETFCRTFLVRKLGLYPSAELIDAVREILGIYDVDGAPRQRAVVCYMLVRYFGMEAHYGIEERAD